MARKNLLLRLDRARSCRPATRPAGDRQPTPLPKAPHLCVMGTRGAIGAVTRSIEQLKAQAVVELDAHLIEASFIADRLERPGRASRSGRVDPRARPAGADPRATESGKGRPISDCLRPPAPKGGHRTRTPVRAIVKPLTDEQLVVAQGQENSARTICPSSRERYSRPNWNERVQPRDDHGRPKRRQDRTLAADLLRGQNSA